MCSAIFLRITDIGAVWPASAADGFCGSGAAGPGRTSGAGLPGPAAAAWSGGGRGGGVDARRGSGGRRLGPGAALSDDRHHAVDRNRLAFLVADLGEDAGDRRGNLGVDFVRGDLEQRLVALDVVA